MGKESDLAERIGVCLTLISKKASINASENTYFSTAKDSYAVKNLFAERLDAASGVHLIS